ncbi:MAG: Holliday junction branch migration protein RuvA [Bdellovibrionaceae bacterium]|nr:Holliday junction branch migration protein RuvA [Pseudobdellovibrionaceae bacterium]|tara:strand:- start:152018 stop:152596 length:579 start_codon:yes stop_codon:yes gene_type:complete
MIGFVRGKLIEINESDVLVDVQGVGYELHCSQSTIADLSGLDFVKVYAYTHVREDLIQLFGFSTPLEKQMFLSLIKVNGIGPKMATAILSAAPVDVILGYIENEDAKGLSSLPKIGKKKAEQIILSLRGKLVFDTDRGSETQKVAARDEIVSALVNLGFKPLDVQTVVDGFKSDVQVEQGIRMGLSQLANRG